MQRLIFFLLFLLNYGIAFSQSGQSDSAVVAFLKDKYNVRFSDNNSIVFFKTGSEKFEDFFKAIKQAKHSIHLEYFNFRNDSISHLLFDLLAQKANEGVEVRAMFDGFGNTSNDRPILPQHTRELRQRGIEIVEFDPMKFPYIQNAFHRDHRKVVVIDGLIAYTGGMNVADYYITGKPEFGAWRDLHCRIEGDAVAELQKVFLDFWNQETGQDIKGTQYYPGERIASDIFHGLKPDTTETKGLKTIGVVNRIPRYSSRIIEETFIAILDAAEHHIELVNPYFTLSRKIKKAFERTIKRGVKVRIMVSDKCDIPVSPNVLQHYTEQFRKLGATIHIFNQGFHHSKAMMVDNRFIFMGSSNLNGRSLKLDYECNVLIVDSASTLALKSIYEDDCLNSSTTRLPSDSCQVPAGKKFLNWMLHYLTPFL
ncbi:MAG: cardiolipin synthase [Bacteroidaceae bacterium]|nr:cardiolipin synthase [Bacteroidaceae bacterium]